MMDQRPYIYLVKPQTFYQCVLILVLIMLIYIRLYSGYTCYSARQTLHVLIATVFEYTSNLEIKKVT